MHSIPSHLSSQTSQSPTFSFPSTTTSGGLLSTRSTSVSGVHEQASTLGSSEPSSDFPPMVQGLALHEKYKLTDNLTDLNKAIELLEKAVLLTADNHEDLPQRLSDLGDALSDRFDQMGDLEDISHAIGFQQRAVSLTPEGHDDLPSLLNNLGVSFSQRFDRTGNLDDITAAIEHQQRSISLTPDGHADLPARLCNLGVSFSSRFELTGDPNDISAEIKHQERAVRLTPEDHSTLPATLSNLGVSYLQRFEEMGDVTSLSAAIKHQQKAVDLTSELEDHSPLPIMLSNLGLLFSQRFRLMGDLADLSTAIECQQKACTLTADGRANLPTILTNLGSSFLLRFIWTGDLSDITAAIEHEQQSVELTLEGDAGLPTRLNNLGSSLSQRFERTGDLADISAAMKHLQRSVALTPEGHSELPTRLNNLGRLFSQRFERTRDPTDISSAIENQQKAVDLTPEGKYLLPISLNNLAASFSKRLVQVGDPSDLMSAIEHQERAISLSPEGDPNFPTWSIGLGSLFIVLYQHSHDIQDLQDAVHNFRLGAIQNSGSPSARFDAAKLWARVTRDQINPTDSLPGFGLAIELLSLTIGINQAIYNQHARLADISDLVTEAVSVAFTTGRTDKALEWLEEGRCLIWQQLNQLRTPVDVLRDYDAALADQFVTVSKALELSNSRSELSGPSTLTQQIEAESKVGAHLRLSKERAQLVDRIRDIPDFQNFLRPAKANDILSHVPPGGTVVVVNVDKSHCDALALVHGRDTVLHIPLPDFRFETAEGFRHDLHEYLARKSLLTRTNRAIRFTQNPAQAPVLRQILHQLWTAVVWPILQGLGYCSPPSDRRRIWWCATGPLAFLPLHAAGVYGKGDESSGLCLTDFAVSSYIPTVRTLVEKHKEFTKSGAKPITKVLLVSQPDTPGQERIPNTKKETQVIFDLSQEHEIAAVILESGEGSIVRVKKAMTSHSWVHFACHAFQNPIKSLESGFALFDGQLNLLDIIRMDLPNAEFAFLSACQTSVGDEKLSEEAVHLAAGMLGAGYMGVVGTMWSIQDTHAPDIAEAFYRYLLEEPSAKAKGRLDNREAAYALDHAMQKIRKSVGDNELGLLIWVPYIHFGL